jgi:hypothetical protein
MFNKPSYNIDKAMISGAQAEEFKAWDRRLPLLMSKATPIVHLFDQRPSALPLNLVGRSSVQMHESRRELVTANGWY